MEGSERLVWSRHRPCDKRCPFLPLPKDVTARRVTILMLCPYTEGR